MFMVSRQGGGKFNISILIRGKARSPVSICHAFQHRIFSTPWILKSFILSVLFCWLRQKLRIGHLPKRVLKPSGIRLYPEPTLARHGTDIHRLVKVILTERVPAVRVTWYVLENQRVKFSLAQNTKKTAPKEESEQEKT